MYVYIYIYIITDIWGVWKQGTLNKAGFIISFFTTKGNFGVCISFRHTRMCKKGLTYIIQWNGFILLNYPVVRREHELLGFIAFEMGYVVGMFIGYLMGYTVRNLICSSIRWWIRSYGCIHIYIYYIISYFIILYYMIWYYIILYYSHF